MVSQFEVWIYLLLSKARKHFQPGPASTAMLLIGEWVYIGSMYKREQGRGSECQYCTTHSKDLPGWSLAHLAVGYEMWPSQTHEHWSTQTTVVLSTPPVSYSPALGVGLGVFHSIKRHWNMEPDSPLPSRWWHSCVSHWALMSPFQCARAPCRTSLEQAGRYERWSEHDGLCISWPTRSLIKGQNTHSYWYI